MYCVQTQVSRWESKEDVVNSKGSKERQMKGTSGLGIQTVMNAATHTLKTQVQSQGVIPDSQTSVGARVAFAQLKLSVPASDILRAV